MRWPYLEEIFALVIGGYSAYVFALGSPYAIIDAGHQTITTLAQSIETQVPGLHIDPQTASWTYIPPPPGYPASYMTGPRP